MIGIDIKFILSGFYPKYFLPLSYSFFFFSDFVEFLKRGNPRNFTSRYLIYIIQWYKWYLISLP